MLLARRRAQGDVIRGIAFPCKHNRCLTQTPHHVDKADAVSPVRMPTPLHIPVVRSSVKDLPRPARDSDEPDDEWTDEDFELADDVLRIGPTEHLNGAPRKYCIEVHKF